MRNPIIELRQRNNIPTRRELARRTGLSYETCSLYETGQRRRITENAVQKFSKVLDVEPQKLQEEYKGWKESLKA